LANPDPSTSFVARRVVDGPFCAAVLVAILVLVPRSWHVAANSSPCRDDQYHLTHGLWMLGAADTGTLNDPPLGEAILALPLRIAGVNTEHGRRPDVIFDQRISPQAILEIVAVWKALLFVPAVAIVFCWCRQLYGTASAWLAVALMLVEPTIAGHLPVAALDTLALEAVIVASFAVWRYVQSPSMMRLAIAAIFVAVALLVKHTAAPVVVSAVIVVLIAARRRGESMRRAVNAVAVAGIICLVSIWVLCGFDFSKPAELGYLSGVQYDNRFSLARTVEPAMSIRWPAGIYLSSLINAADHLRSGHEAFLWGRHSRQGWWYYYPAVAMYKVPIGVLLVFAIAMLSFLWRRPRWEELSLAIPAAACGAMIVFGGVNVGFRHALPAWGLMLMLASRAVSSAPMVVKLLAWLGVGAAAIHVTLCHPDYIAYINAPWPKPYLAISDSNIDWGQSLPAVSRWLDARPANDHRPVWVDFMETAVGKPIDHYLDGRVKLVGIDSVDPPNSGLLVVTPWWIAGLYGRGEQYAYLRNEVPDGVIGHNLLVYDLDRIRARGDLP
jgi:hypothetical protein